MKNDSDEPATAPPNATGMPGHRPNSAPAVSVISDPGTISGTATA